MTAPSQPLRSGPGLARLLTLLQWVQRTGGQLVAVPAHRGRYALVHLHESQPRGASMVGAANGRALWTAHRGGVLTVDDSEAATVRLDRDYHGRRHGDWAHGYPVALTPLGAASCPVCLATGPALCDTVGGQAHRSRPEDGTW